MTKRTLTPLKQSGATRKTRPDKSWAVYYPAIGQKGITSRRRTFFRHRAEAEAFCAIRRAEIASLGLRANSLSEDLKEQALACSELLSPIGITLLDAVRGFIKDFKASEDSVLVKDAAKALLQRASTDGLSHRHKLTLSSVLSLFCATHGEMYVAKITTNNLQAWLDAYRKKDGTPLSPVSFNSYRRYLALFFSFCQKRGWTNANPFSGVAIKKVKLKTPRLLSPSELKTILYKAPTELRLTVGILAHCGLRVSEASRLCWEDILLRKDEAYIQIGSESSKTSKRRLTPIPAALRATIEAVEAKKGYVFQSGKGSVNALQLALTKLRASVKGVTWGKNALRASALSYRLALTKDVAATAFEMGNSPNVLMADYRELTTPAEAEKWFSVRV